MSRNKEKATVEACNCECDCPADVLQAGADGQELKAVADRANRTMNTATNRAGDALNSAADRLNDLRKQFNASQERTNLMERLGIAAALATAASQAQDRQNKVAGTVKYVGSRASDRMQDVRSSAADTLQSVTNTASDRLDDVRSMAADRLEDLRSTAADRFEDLSKVLPRKRKPSLWQRLAFAGMAAGLMKRFKNNRKTLGDAVSGATKKAKAPKKLMAMGALGTKMGKGKAEKQAKRAFGRLRRQAPARRSASPLAWGLALGLGAGLMYFLDPQMGSRRRGLARDQFVHMRHLLMDRFGDAREEMSNRAQGMVAEAHRYTRDDEPSSRALAERVRAQLGFLVSHPGSIDVTANDGVVTLRGPILAAEVEPLLTRVRLIPGVTSVENRLDVHQQPGDVPGLQGGMSRENM